MSATLVIERKKAFVACLRKAKVLVDQEEIGFVANGKSESFSISPGPHSIAVKLGASSCRPLNIDAVEGQETKLKCAIKMGLFAVSDFVLTREDGTGADSGSAPSGHHGKIVLICGLAGFLIGLIGVAALGQGIMDLKKMNRGEMDDSGRNLTLAGTILGGVGTILYLLRLVSKLSELGSG